MALQSKTWKSISFLIQKLIHKFTNIVLDAEAIDNYDFSGKKILLTPHSGELKKLGVTRTVDAISDFSKVNKITILLKGKIDTIAGGISVKYNSSGHARMAVGGSGDILAGFCGSLLAKGLSPFEAGRLASYANGIAGEKAFQKYGSGFLPTELSLMLSKILKK